MEEFREEMEILSMNENSVSYQWDQAIVTFTVVDNRVIFEEVIPVDFINEFADSKKDMAGWCIHYIKNYKKIKDEIELLKDRCLEIETELNKTGGSIIKVSKDIKNNITGLTLRQNELFNYLCHYQDGINDLNFRLRVVDDYLNFLKKENKMWYIISKYRVDGLSIERIGEMDEIKYDPSSIWYIIRESMKKYLHQRNHEIIKYNSKT